MALLTSRSEVASAGAQRLHQQALYAAESGISAGMEYLRGACTPDELFSQIVEPSNVNAQQPSDIQGNGYAAGQNLFAADSELKYTVTVLNNQNDPGFITGADRDGIVILRSVGAGPDRSQAIIEMEVLGQNCLATACQTDYAQRGMTARNDSLAACANQIASNAVTTFNVGGP